MKVQDLEKAIKEWAKGQPAWVGHAIRDLWLGNIPDIGKLALMCVRSARGLVEVGRAQADEMVSTGTSAGAVKILSVGNVTGISRLKEKSALEFGKKQMAIVYGLNGAGKSSFVRILKAVAGAPDAHKLLTDVYSEENPSQSCTVKYSIADAEKVVLWSAERGPVEDLRQIDVFDTGRGELYFEENEVTYEPPVLMLFTKLIDVATNVTKKLEGWKKSVLALPVSHDVERTETYRHVVGAIGDESFRQLLNTVVWTEVDERKVEELRLRLSEKTPKDRAKEIQKRKVWLEKLIEDVRKRMYELSNEQYQKVVAAQKNAAVKRETANLAAKELFSSSAKLEGVGSAVWRELWSAAKQYAMEKAYPGREYPSKENGARCVLCHQELGVEAWKRMEEFENYVRGTAQKEADAAQLVVKNLQEGFPTEFKEEDLLQKLDAAGVSGVEERKLLIAFNASVKDRRLAFLQDSDVLSLPVLVDMADWLSSASEKAKELENSARELLTDAESGEVGRIKIRGELDELLAKKWIFENKKHLGRMHVWKRLNADLEAAKRLTTTAKMSAKKSELAEAVVTEAYARRFKKELAELSGGRIKVALSKSRVAKGRVLHRILLESSKKAELKSVLSEGESRIVSLAAFLADSEGNQTTSPFVFDDPISSLDQKYEEAVAKRLIRLATTRQVIVFTHRLSMLGTIMHYIKHYKEELRVEADCSAIREFEGTAGLKTEFPMGNIGSALNRMIGETASRCKKLKESENYHAYELELKGMCSEFRVLIESSVETDLLCGVVLRYVRAVSTQKIPLLGKMRDSDYRLLNDLMTKYSGFEHSQPQEAPVPLPPLDEIIADAKLLIDWRNEYKSRKATSSE